MDPFARKMILASLAFGGFMLVIAAALSVVYLHYHPRCSERVLSETTSPDGRWRAAGLERRCGDDSPFFVHVNVRPAADPIRLEYFSGRAEEGEVFVAEEETQAATPELAWTGTGELAIRCPNCRPALVHRREEHWGPIAVRYHLQP